MMRRRLSVMVALAAISLSSCTGGKLWTPPNFESVRTLTWEYLPVEQHGTISVAAKTDAAELLLEESNLRLGLKNAKQEHWSSPNEISANLSTDVRNELRSHFVIHYYNNQRQPMTMYSYSDSVVKGQYETLGIKDGIRIEYTLGEEEPIDLFPAAVSVDTMETVIMPALDEEEA